MNTTATPSIRYMLYAFEGILLIPCNGLILLTILYHWTLRERKELILPAALAFCDTAEGLGALLAGLGRNWLIVKGKDNVLMSRRDCLLKPWNIPWVLIHHIGDPTLFSISVDRIVAVAFPLFHFGLDRSYAILLLLGAWSVPLAAYVYAVYAASISTEAAVRNLCFTSLVYSKDYGTVLFSVRIVLSVCSVLLYVVVVVLYWKQGLVQAQGQGSQFEQYLVSQRRLTVTLGLSCLFTCTFYLGPVLVRTGLNGFGLMQSSIALTVVPYAYIVENINRLLNLLLYSFRHKSLRMGILKLFQCKQLNMAAAEKPKIGEVRFKKNDGVNIAWA